MVTQIAKKPVSIKETKYVVKTLPSKKTLGFINSFYQTLKKEKIPNLCIFFQKYITTKWSSS